MPLGALISPRAIKRLISDEILHGTLNQVYGFGYSFLFLKENFKKTLVNFIEGMVIFFSFSELN
ncbi:hypothetical protein LEP1GSC073_0852 [Leptospira noguchii str. Cascata]|nr:hypothetical protein LEP1GSC073_0852 [Leptospira noguchii str. Cascata]